MISITINYIFLFELIFFVKNNNVENFLDYFGKKIPLFRGDIRPNYRPNIRPFLAEYSVSADTNFTCIGRSLVMYIVAAYVSNCLQLPLPLLRKEVLLKNSAQWKMVQILNESEWAVAFCMLEKIWLIEFC